MSRCLLGEAMGKENESRISLKDKGKPAAISRGGQCSVEGGQRAQNYSPLGVKGESFNQEVQTHIEKGMET